MERTERPICNEYWDNHRPEIFEGSGTPECVRRHSGEGLDEMALP